MILDPVDSLHDLTADAGIGFHSILAARHRLQCSVGIVTGNQLGPTHGQSHPLPDSWLKPRRARPVTQSLGRRPAVFRVVCRL